jgi:hypothetical protein
MRLILPRVGRFRPPGLRPPEPRQPWAGAASARYARLVWLRPLRANCEDDGVSQAQPTAQKPASVRVIARQHRVALVAAGLVSWLAGGIASFRSLNGAGAAALIAAGVVCLLLSFIGRWPTRISVSGNEVSWSEVDETVASQIRAALASGEEKSVIAELQNLQSRLRGLQQTGEIPPHPAETYDQEVERAIARILGGAEVIRHHGRSDAIADFLVSYHGQELYVETKWRSDSTPTFTGSNLPRLLAGLETRAVRLLVVVNIPSISPDASKIVIDALGERGGIVTWRDSRDDAILGEALNALLAG